jgi:O-antigen ligase
MMSLNVSGGRGMNDDDGGRVAAWSTGLEIFKSHPIAGVGLSQFADYNETGHTAHNSYILALSETGLLGYFCWMGTIVANYSGLSEIVRWKGRRGQVKPEAELGPLPPHLRYRTAMSSVRGIPGTLSLKTATAGEGFASPVYGTAVAPTWAPASVRFGDARTQGTVVEDGELIHAAKVLRVSFVGLLTSAFFLSRSFSMVFYVLLGMSAVVRIIFLAKHPDQVTDRKLMFKRILMVLAGSVVFLHLFVRIRGVHG